MRDELRGKIFSNIKKRFRRKKVEFAGVELEIRQPSVKDMLNLRNANEGGDDLQAAMVTMIVNHCYIPDTDERVFEEADREQLLSMPFDKGFADINNAIAEMTGVDIEGSAKNSEETQ